MTMHEYTWKSGLQFMSCTVMRTNKPLTVNTIVVDLYNGSRFLVHSIYKAKPTDKEWASMPDTVVHVWPIERLAESELSKVWEKAQYTPGEFPLPLEDVVFLPAAA